MYSLKDQINITVVWVSKYLNCETIDKFSPRFLQTSGGKQQSLIPQIISDKTTDARKVRHILNTINYNYCESC